MDFQKLGCHNPRVEREAIHEGQEDPKADLHRGLEEAAAMQGATTSADHTQQRSPRSGFPEEESARPVDDLTPSPSSKVGEHARG